MCREGKREDSFDGGCFETATSQFFTFKTLKMKMFKKKSFSFSFKLNTKVYMEWERKRRFAILVINSRRMSRVVKAAAEK